MPNHELLLKRLYRAGVAYFLAREVGLPENNMPRQRVRSEMLSALAEVQLLVDESWIGNNDGVASEVIALYGDYIMGREQITIDSLTLNGSSFTLFVNGEPHLLGNVEYSIMAFLMQQPGRVFTYQEIMRVVWGQDKWQEMTPALVRVHVRNIRMKIEPDPSNPIYLRTVKGHGYTVDPPKRGD